MCKKAGGTGFCAVPPAVHSNMYIIFSYKKILLTAAVLFTICILISLLLADSLSKAGLHLAVAAGIAGFIVIARRALLILLRRLNPRFDTPLCEGPWFFILEWSFILIVTFAGLSLIDLLREWWIIATILGFSLLAVIPTFDFVIRPIFFLFRSGLEKPPVKLERWARKALGAKVTLRVYRGSLLNAYATGVIPFFRFILLGKPLLENLSEKDLHAILAHEIGHLSLNHPLFAYLTSVASVWVWASVMHLVYKLPLPFMKGALVAAITGGILGGLFYGLIPGFVLRKLELAADQFAATLVGSKAYMRALKNLDLFTKGKVSKGGLTHPPLIQRLENIRILEQK